MSTALVDTHRGISSECRAVSKWLADATSAGALPISPEHVTRKLFVVILNIASTTFDKRETGTVLVRGARREKVNLHHLTPEDFSKVDTFRVTFRRAGAGFTCPRICLMLVNISHLFIAMDCGTFQNGDPQPAAKNITSYAEENDIVQSFASVITQTHFVNHIANIV
ncbi:hypothetical protein CBL_10989 [Carabus blaptoides fortunei]